jgi:hypothetical protein
MLLGGLLAPASVVLVGRRARMQEKLKSSIKTEQQKHYL